MTRLVKWPRVICAFALAAPVFGQLTITTTSPLPAATLQSPYNLQFSATGGAGALTWSAPAAADTLPPGLSLGSSGALTGTPTKTGTYSFLVTVIDQQRQAARQNFSLTVQSSPPVITSSSPLSSGTVGVAYSFSFSATGGLPPYSWSVTAGSLPAGLTLAAGGSLTGAPTAAGQFTFTVQVVDSPPAGRRRKPARSRLACASRRRFQSRPHRRSPGRWAQA